MCVYVCAYMWNVTKLVWYMTFLILNDKVYAFLFKLTPFKSNALFFIFFATFLFSAWRILLECPSARSLRLSWWAPRLKKGETLMISLSWKEKENSQGVKQGKYGVCSRAVVFLSAMIYQMSSTSRPVTFKTSKFLEIANQTLSVFVSNRLSIIQTSSQWFPQNINVIHSTLISVLLIVDLPLQKSFSASHSRVEILCQSHMYTTWCYFHPLEECQVRVTEFSQTMWKIPVSFITLCS